MTAHPSKIDQASNILLDRPAAVDARRAIRTVTAVACQTQFERSVALLTDDRAEHLVPSIRHATISMVTKGGETVILREPSVADEEWRDPTDTTPNASKGPRRIKGVKRANNLRTLQLRGTPLSSDHIIAGEIYEQDWEFGQSGHFPGAPPPEVRGAPGPGDYSRMFDSGRAFQKAEAAIGALGADLLRHVLLGREGAPPADLTTWASAKRFNKRPLDRKAAVGVLIATLELLVDHYGARRIINRRRNEVA